MGRVRGLLGCLLAALPIGGSAPGRLVEVPKGPPVLLDAARVRPAALERIRGLGDDDFAVRERAQAELQELVEQHGRGMRPILEEHAGDADPEVRARIAALLDGIAGEVDLPDLVAKGLTPEARQSIVRQGPALGARMVEAHLEGRIGFDVLYSLPPALVFPRAFALLEIQEEDYYRAQLLRLVDAVLARAALPVGDCGTREFSAEGIRYLADHPEAAGAIRARLADRSEEGRLAALRAAAHGLVPVDPKTLAALREDPAPRVAEEARRLSPLFRGAGERQEADPVVDAWIDACVGAVGQDGDGLAQLGGYRALADLRDRRIPSLVAAARRAQGRGRDALRDLLVSDREGRLALWKADGEIGSTERPGTLGPLLLLGEYDRSRRGLSDLAAHRPADVAPLLRRNLANLSPRPAEFPPDRRWFRGVADDPESWAAAQRLGMGDLADDLEAWRSEPMDEGARGPLEAILGDLRRGAVRAPVEAPAEAWYRDCAAALRSPEVDVRTGAVRGILLGGRAAALALGKRWKAWKEEPSSDPAWVAYVRSLCLFHPCTKFVLAEIGDAELSRAWEERGPKLRGRLAGETYRGGPDQIPFAIFGYVHNNDCNYLHPVGSFLARNLTPTHAPLLLAWMDHNSRMSIFLAEIGARESIPAIRRRLEERRKDWGMCYDHDFFHAAAAFEIDDAFPTLEDYAKTNPYWRSLGLLTLAGGEESRFCWTNDAFPGRANPLAAPAVLEILELSRRGRLPRDDRLVERGREALRRMGFPAGGGPIGYPPAPR